MKLAVVLLNYNNAYLTIQCVNSIRRCSFFSYIVDIIIVDNNSNDNSRKELDATQGKLGYILLKSDKNVGFSAGNNIGIRYALENDYDYIMMMNNDTEVQSDFFRVLSKEIEKEKIIVPKIMNYYKKNVIWYAGGDINQWTGKARHVGEGKYDTQEYNYRQKVSFATGCCIILPSSIIKKIGLLDEGFFLYWEDVEYSLRIIDKELSINYIPELVIFHKISSTTGRESPTLLYYGTRNRLLIVVLFKNHFHVSAFYITLFVELLKAFRYWLVDRNKGRVVFRGIMDGIRRKTGEIQII